MRFQKSFCYFLKERLLYMINKIKIMSKLRYESFVSYRSMDDLLDQINEKIDADDIVEIKHSSEIKREKTGWDEYDTWISTVYRANVLYKERG